MIGVALSVYDAVTVSEFFELFKTPWEYFRPDRVYDVIICDQAELDIVQARLVIVIHRDEGSPIEHKETILREPVLLRSREVTFPVYTGIKKITGGLPLISVENTADCVGSHFDQESKTILHLGYDFFEEAKHQLTNGQPLQYASYPTLDIHISNLRTWILGAGVALLEIPPVAKGSRFFACLTHDIDFAGIRNHKFDRTMIGFVYRALVKSVVQYTKGQYSFKMLARNWMAVAGLPFIYLGLLRDFWSTFSCYRKIEGEALSTFFFVPFKDKPGVSGSGSAPSIRAVKYDIANLRKEALHLRAQGCEIGVHGIDSWAGVEQAKTEMDKVRELIGPTELGVRMHWLYFGPESPAKLEQAGYTFDSTCGYNAKIGYKAGTSQVYRHPGTRYLLELPMVVMDTALFYSDRMNLTLSEGINTIKSIIESAARHGGVLTFNWHDRSIAPERLWDGVYRCSLNELQRQGAFFMTAGAVVSWFRKRRAVVFDQVYSSRSSIKVKLTGLQVSPTDGMILRLYPPAKSSPQGGGDTSAIMAYQDFLLAEQREVEFFL